MKLSECVACTLPVIELEGQFNKLDSYFLGEGGPPRSSAGYWHTSCLRASSVGRAWQAARLRNYRDVRRFEVVAEPPDWIVIRDPQRGSLLALGATGELVDLAVGRRKAARSVEGGVVFARVEEEFHLELEDAAAVAEIKTALDQASVCPLPTVLAALGVADRVADPVALESATFRYEKSLRSFWDTHGVSARLEYGVFVPRVLEAYAREGASPVVSMAPVVADPHDEQARSAYARAIAATDPARAELIEVQLQLTRCRKARIRPDDWGKLVHREHALLTAHRARWAAGIRELVDGTLFLRGFVDKVTLPARRFLANAAELYRRAPILHLDLTEVQEVAAELFASPHLARIESLGLSRSGLGDAEASLLAGSPHLGNLTWLDLHMNEIGRSGLEALAASTLLPKLRYVDFADNAIADPTPRFADEYDSDSPVARELQQKYGPRPWLSAEGHGEWPPPRDAAY